VGLQCTVCRRLVDEGLNFCPECHSGFVSQLSCAACGRLVPRGQASCQGCRGAGVPTHPEVLPPQVSLVAPRCAPPAALGLPPHVTLPAPVPSSYVVRGSGVVAEVRRAPGDAEVETVMGQMVVVLHSFAAKLNTLTGHSELTRGIIRASRALAADVQEELELRKGPGR
jgi:RNA polymerase subunit RPABC4/transcription elongation factor Spt4